MIYGEQKNGRQVDEHLPKPEKLGAAAGDQVLFLSPSSVELTYCFLTAYVRLN